MGSIIIVSVLIGAIGLLIGLVLGIAQKKLAVEVDEREVAIRAVLPGNNCGGCGYPGCDGLAAAIVEGKAPNNGCPVGGSECAKQIAAIMGEEADENAHYVAYVHCIGDCDKAARNYQYYGVQDCSMMQYVPDGGSKRCSDGCLGYGNCVKACPFEAINIVNGIAVVDKDKCKACGKCIKECPKHLITLVPYDATAHIACHSSQKGKSVMDACKNGCISCTKCVRTCPNEAIVMQNNLPMIDYNKCTNCGTCVSACPRKTIQ